MGIGYIIISRPDYIEFRCPHCNRDVKVEFRLVEYNTKFWDDGATCECPECEMEVELGSYEYN